MQALILAGGFGTRLRPLTIALSKLLMPILNKPMLQYQIELLREHNIKDIILCVNYKLEQIKEYFGDGKKLGVKIEYVIEEEPLGTAGAIKNAEETIKEEEIFILNGDIITQFNLKEMMAFHKKNNSIATIAATPVEDVYAYGLVITDKNSKIIEFREKPRKDEYLPTNTINAGVYILNKRVLEYIPKNKFVSIEKEIYPTMLKNNERMYGFIYDEYWLDIGTPQKYMKINFDLLKKENRTQFYGNDVKIGENVKIQGYLIIGNNCVIEENVELENVIIWNNCRINKDAKIYNSILGDNSQILEGAFIKNVVIANDSRISVGVGAII